MADNAIDFQNLEPNELKNYVGCFVELTVCEIGKLQGWVYTIDPVSRNIILAKESEENTKAIVVVIAKSVKKFRVMEATKGEPKWLNDFASKRKHEFTNEELEKRKKHVLEWLSKNRVPVEICEQENINVIGGLVIEPPYDVESCQGTNEIVLERIRKLLSSMPNEYEVKTEINK